MRRSIQSYLLATASAPKPVPMDLGYIPWSNKGKGKDGKNNKGHRSDKGKGGKDGLWNKGGKGKSKDKGEKGQGKGASSGGGGKGDTYFAGYCGKCGLW
eukprot:4560841-Amphidinium_carterae.1